MARGFITYCAYVLFILRQTSRAIVIPLSIFWHILPSSIAYYFSMIYNVWAALGIWGLTFAERLVLRGKITPNPDDVRGLKSAAKVAASYLVPALGASDGGVP